MVRQCCFNFADQFWLCLEAKRQIKPCAQAGATPPMSSLLQTETDTPAWPLLDLSADSG